MSPSSLCSGVVVSRVRTSSSIHRFRRRFHRSRFLVWWCTRLVVLWSPSSFPRFSGRPRQRWIGRWVSATPTSTMSSPTPPRPLWTKSSASSSKSNRKRAKEEEAFFWGRQNRYGSFAIRVAFAEGRHKSALLFQKGKKKGKCKMCLDIPCATRQDTRALARCTRPRCRTPRRFDRAQPRSTFFSSSFLRSSSFRRRRLLLERSTTLLVRVIRSASVLSRSSFPV